MLYRNRKFVNFFIYHIQNRRHRPGRANLFGTHNTAHWRGEITLYVDPSVTYAGRQVGGIRIKENSAAPQAYNNGH